MDSSRAKSFVHPALPRQVNEISVLLTSDREIKKLNHLFRHKNKATDVLSFSQIEGGAVGTILGDLVISLDTAKKQAKEYKVTLDQEVLRLIVHGLLHLFGYDHENVSQRRVLEMHRAEDKLFCKYSRDISFIVRQR